MVMKADVRNAVRLDIVLGIAELGVQGIHTYGARVHTQEQLVTEKIAPTGNVTGADHPTVGLLDMIVHTE